MIRINLLKAPTTPGKSKPQASGNARVGEVVILGLLTLAGLLGVFFYWQSIESDIEWAKRKVYLEEQEVAKLQIAIKTEEQYKATRTLLKKQKDVIDRLKQAKHGPVRVLDQLSRLIPAKVWLQQIRQENRNMTIDGEAEANENVALFLKRLQDSAYFDGVELKFTHKITGQTIGDRDIERIRFSFTCVVNFTI